jgi:hypothetical protein
LNQQSTTPITNTNPNTFGLGTQSAFNLQPSNVANTSTSFLTSLNKPTTTTSTFNQGGLNLPSNTLYNPNTSTSMQNPSYDPNVNEILNVIQYYLWSLDPTSPYNSYKQMVYNRVPKGHEGQIRQYQDYKPTIFINGVSYAIDQGLWITALNNNPLPNQLIPFQISSPEHLVERIRTTNILEYQVSDTLMSFQQTVNNINNTYDNEMDKEINEIMQKQKRVKELMTSTAVKLDKLAIIIQRADKNFTVENSLISNLNNINKLYLESNGVKERLNLVNMSANNLNFEKDQYDNTDNTDNFTEQRITKNVNVLRDMKKILDSLKDQTRHNFSMVNFIKSDLDYVKKYGKVQK